MCKHVKLWGNKKRVYKAEEDKKIDLSIFVWTRFEKTLKTLVFRVAEEKVFERNRLIKQSISYYWEMAKKLSSWF